MQASNFSNQFLIAMPSLRDPNFSQTVTYICAHNEDGAMGLVINRPANCDLGEILTQMEMKPDDQSISKIPVYQGGPVHTDRGFVLHEPNNEWDSSINVSEFLNVTTSRDILHAIAERAGPQNYLIALGYAGWSAGQLEEEIKENAWLNVSADPDIIFNTPCELRWSSATALLGIDHYQISTGIGHA
ncbi:MAG: YqgE/AlgH family protein [Gammaproteobacteria bacterium]|nr:YqgE/AlgH family protein [Gammaproteobacteria bacterium]